ncbi:uncharacterized protein [Nicotiana tomentosiformis]|uniref:uncharacterized protein n=1 Tax=Nicotiana tomentosiformis TaxID=4098 RepID=UPI00388C6196
MDPNSKLMPGQGEPLSDPASYRRLVGKLNYLTVTRPDISYPVSLVSQFMNSPCDSHWDAVVHIIGYIKLAPGKGLLFEDRGHEQIIGYSDADWAGSPSDRRSTSGYCVLVGENLVSWKSKKQNVVARSSAEAEYREMPLATCELVWTKQLLKELKFGEISRMELVCDNQAALHIASNPVFHERTKHIEIDCHFVREKILSGEIATKFVRSGFKVGSADGNSVTISHLLYADDTLIFCEAEKSQVLYLNLTLMIFEAISGLHMNMLKRIIYPVNSVLNLEELAEVMCCKVVSFPTTYLGLPLGAKYKALAFLAAIFELKFQLFMVENELEKIGAGFVSEGQSVGGQSVGDKHGGQAWGTKKSGVGTRVGDKEWGHAWEDIRHAGRLADAPGMGTSSILKDRSEVLNRKR